MPNIDDLMQEWPENFEELLKEVSLPSAEIDCDLPTYVDMICGKFIFRVEFVTNGRYLRNIISGKVLHVQIHQHMFIFCTGVVQIRFQLLVLCILKLNKFVVTKTDIAVAFE